jgi:thioredoxin-related protein
MKRTLSYILIIFLTVWLSDIYAQAPSSSANKINWMDFEEAVEASKKKPKKMFLDMYTDWCGWCKKMDQSTFINPIIVEYMNKNFYAVKFNAERKDAVNFNGKEYVNPNPSGRRSSHQLAQYMLNGRMSYPSFVFLDENQKHITIVPGYRKAPEFESILNFIGSDSYKSKKWEEFISGFTPAAAE